MKRGIPHTAVRAMKKAPVLPGSSASSPASTPAQPKEACLQRVSSKPSPEGALRSQALEQYHGLEQYCRGALGAPSWTRGNKSSTEDLCYPTCSKVSTTF